jgi:hypothetical protein
VRVDPCPYKYVSCAVHACLPGPMFLLGSILDEDLEKWVYWSTVDAFSCGKILICRK